MGKGIAIHHSATPDQGVLDYVAIARYHTEVNGWSDIGYHAVVEQTDRGVACLYGRSVYRYGAHIYGHNDALGLCFVGNYDRLPPPSIMVDAAIQRIIVPWCIQFGFTERDIRGHREFPGVHKSCPGSAFDLDSLRQRVREELA